MQTSYDYALKSGIVGELVDNSMRRVDSYNCEGGNVRPGYGVVKGSDSSYEKGKVKLPSASTDKFVGVALLQAKEQSLYTGDIVFKDGETLGVVNFMGRVHVPVVGAVNVDDTAALIYSGANAGKFCSSTNAITEKIVLTSVFRSATAGDGTAILELRGM